MSVRVTGCACASNLLLHMIFREKKTFGRVEKMIVGGKQMQMLLAT
jgi:hypothetical protein